MFSSPLVQLKFQYCSKTAL